VGQYVTKAVLGYQEGFDPAISAAKQAVCFLQISRCAALGALMFDDKINDFLRSMIQFLQFFATVVAIKSFREVFIAAFGTKIRFGSILHRMAATGTKLGTWRQIFTACLALLKDKLLMAALGAKFCIHRYEVVTFPASCVLRPIFRWGGWERACKVLGEHSRHHQSKPGTHSHTSTIFSL
jgi:hypothetical protein